jgi:protein gp37
MAENSKIQWTTHTFNPWRGCQKVAAGCANCYAETLSKRNPGTLGIWGPNGTRVLASEAMWREPGKWNKEAFYDSFGKPLKGESHDRPRVFCASLADVFEDWQGRVVDCRGDVMWHRSDKGIVSAGGTTVGNVRDERHATLDDARARLFRLIDATPNLDWLVLTKRPESVRRMWPAYQNDSSGTRGYSPRVDGVMHGGLRMDNVWLGTSVATQEDAERNVPELLRCRDLAAKLFLSIEPLVGSVDLCKCIGGTLYRCACGYHATEKELIFAGGDRFRCVECNELCALELPVDWVIVGGESGPHARPCNVEWVRSIVRQCRDAGVPCFVKQLGANAQRDHGEPLGWPDCTRQMDPKGGDQSEWPEDLRVREFPVT